MQPPPSNTVAGSVTDFSHSSSLRWLITFGVVFLWIIGISDAMERDSNALLRVSVAIYGVVSLIPLWMWIERVTIDERGIAVTTFGIGPKIEWRDVKSVEFPWKVPGPYAWAYREYALVTLRSGGEKKIAVAGGRASRYLKELMQRMKLQK